jgi:DNA-binding NarL/FixJ family response regulator
MQSVGGADVRKVRFRVLLVDDHAMVRYGLAQMLDAEPDIEVVGQAADGREGIELARSLRPNVILMDVSMPGMNGVEAVWHIKEEMPDIHVIGVSMHDMVGVRQSMLDAGADDYVSKDSSPDVLLAAIRWSAGD